MIRTIPPGPVRGRVRAPPSKSYTHRALVAGFLSGHPTEILSPLDSDDTRATAQGLVALGAEVRRHRDAWVIRRRRTSSQRAARINCKESGTTLRLLTAVAALGSRPVRFTGEGRLPHRPMDALFRPLRTLGATIEMDSPDAGLPFTIRGPIHAGRVAVSVRESSQPVSALLLALASLPAPSEIRMQGTVVSEPYIDATVAWLRGGGQPVGVRGRTIVIREGRHYSARRIRVPGDASSAAYLWAAAASSGGSVTVDGVDRRWPQADLAILDALSEMGAHVRYRGSSVSVRGPLRRGVRMDLTRSPDLYPLLGALAALVPGASSRLSGAPHLKHKESDRLAETVRLVRAVGGRAVRQRGALRIMGSPRPKALHLTSLSDHRLVMSACVAALAGPTASRIGDARAVRKSFPGFWTTLAHVRGGGGEHR